ncbi:FadR/GntR family transcriptional regulator [Spelaeicoccus albus]|uniref:DNA-binding FadR family transcriptional regulator n=1 Tax=Spelaeicoccus albus TaxID=1280376 RepID=A0A7Z0IID9_9MICO|nr:FCD domain-containing protein [Spelaeicoccus albus]NYI68316.1 DNA-binding FadR family transcriptional regulator [Spelaeicoccus albus]
MTNEFPTAPGLEALDGVVVHKSAPEQIRDHILAAITVGALPPGTKLPAERDLADALRVSRSSVRAALDRLAGIGALRRRRGKSGGTFVCGVPAGSEAADKALAGLSPFWAERQDLLDARTLIQQQIARTAAARRDGDDLEQIGSARLAYESAGDAAGARTADSAFHSAIAAAAHNDHVVRMAIELDGAINAGFRHDPYSPELHKQAVRQHAAIAAAIESGKAEDAGRLTEEHFRATTMTPLPSGTPSTGPASGE